MAYLFNTIFYFPLLNLLVWIYDILPGKDIGLVIIIVTIIIKLILHPFSVKSLKSQKALQSIQPKIDALKEKYKNEKEKMASEMMKLYQEEKVSPFSSCLPLLIQLPFLFAIYQVFRVGLSNGNLVGLYSFIAHPGHINSIAFGFLDLAKPQIVLAILAGLAQFIQTKMLATKTPTPAVQSAGSKDESMMAIMNKQMTYFMPLMTVIIGVSLPGGLVLYWLVITLYTVAQQFFTFRHQEEKKSGTGPKDIIVQS